MGWFDGTIDHAAKELQPVLQLWSDHLVAALQEAVNGIKITVTINVEALPVKKAEPVNKDS